MLNEFVLPKVPKDFSDTTMAKKSYLIAPPSSSYSITTPASIGIKRLTTPHDLDPTLIDLFIRQEDERYKMKLRHQVERVNRVIAKNKTYFCFVLIIHEEKRIFQFHLLGQTNFIS